jgi:hypothetical protein
MEWQTSLLQDLIYERVRQHVDLVSLAELQHEIAESIERVLPDERIAMGEAEVASRQLLDETWERLEREWQQVRGADCPMCAEFGVGRIPVS